MKSILKRIFKRPERPAGLYWEYYNRISLVGDKIKELRLDNYRVLDVGGTKKDYLLGQVGIKNGTTVNLLNDADIIASSHQPPLESRSFECLTCIDTLEHIPKEYRRQVVRELIRVAKKTVFIIVPVDTTENNLAERLVLKHLSSSFVKEHQLYGLVDFDEIRAEVEPMKNEGIVRLVTEHDLDNLMYWVTVMLGEKLEVSELYRELYFLENKFHARREALSIYLR